MYSVCWGSLVRVSAAEVFPSNAIAHEMGSAMRESSNQGHYLGVTREYSCDCPPLSVFGEARGHFGEPETNEGATTDEGLEDAQVIIAVLP